MMGDYIRVSSYSPALQVANPFFNAERMIDAVFKAEENGARVILFPALSITGCTCADLFFDDGLLESAVKALGFLADRTEKTDIKIVAGLPLKSRDAVFSCAAVIRGGKVERIIPFSNELKRTSDKTIKKSEFTVPEEFKGVITDPFTDIDGVGAAIIFAENLLNVDAKETISNGGELILSPSSLFSTPFSLKDRTKKITALSGLCNASILYCEPGPDESTADHVFIGLNVLSTHGETAVSFEAADDGGRILVWDIKKSLPTKSFSDEKKGNANTHYNVAALGESLENKNAFPVGVKNPYLPKDEKEYCKRVFKLQTLALSKRLKITGAKPVIGVSGGLDSTLALLVSVESAKIAGLTPKDVLTVTMPCFGTSDRTYENAKRLMDSLGTSKIEIDIRQSCEIHLKDIGHDLETHDVTYENVQARERTQVLMDIAGMRGGLVVGTGDLSELALGWCTYNGDQMSMYGVNSSIPKTMIPHILRAVTSMKEYEVLKETIEDIIETPISPELLPPGADGNVAQKTESSVGPYELNDFFIYCILKHSLGPEKILEYAKKSFNGEYSKEEILFWLERFYTRFVTQQFKRSCMPDGANVTGFGFSGRTGFYMPSDASAKAWLKITKSLKDTRDE